MTTDGTSGTPDSPRPSPATFNPEADYPDPRDDQQREDDGPGAAQQSAAITDRGNNPHEYVDNMIESIQEARLGMADRELPDPPIQFDVWPDPRPRDPDQLNMGIVILAARGELLLRVRAVGPPDPDEATSAGGAAGASEIRPDWERADALLRELGYTQITDHSPMGLPLRVYMAPDGGVERLVVDRDQVRAATGAEVDLNYVVTLGHVVKADDYPRATAARRCYSPEWIRCHPVRREITVAVIDTGVNHEGRTDGWLAGISETGANIDPLDVFPVREENGAIVRGDGLLDLSAGHGSFVAGTVEQVAPAATIRVYRAVDTEGMGKSDDIANSLLQAARHGADIINLSLGTQTVDNLPPLAFTTAVDIVQNEYPGVVIVASAGNTGQELPLFPAAMKGVVGVGALKADLTPVSWSTHGFWLDCSAVGVGIISTFVRGNEQHTEAGQEVVEHFDRNSWALWSGTSFSAPQIAGGVAQLCQLHDVTPPVALGQLLDGRPVLPGYGTVVPILPGTPLPGP
jgi:Subtilase family